MEFEDEDEDVEEVEVETTPKRSVHGRQPTAFVPKSKARAGQAGDFGRPVELDRTVFAADPVSAQVGFNDGAETVETEEDEETGPKRSTHGRKPTAFVPKSRAAPGVGTSGLRTTGLRAGPPRHVAIDIVGQGRQMTASRFVTQYIMLYYIISY